MSRSTFEQRSVLAEYKTECSKLEEQIRTLTERHRALLQVVAGLESLVQNAPAPSPDKPDVAPDRSLLANGLAVLRYYRRPLNAAQIQRSLSANGVPAKRDTVYRSMRRGADRGLVALHFEGFALPEWRM